ncbi:phosphoribosylformylglycinamidine cyclo-ligase [Longimicrobium terrae]|uniref:Phosphoribosylformylglycinamidine cyclo-ligase n=1 Tax=Longimicrobium terrae TaxID=1639882 RepID=A0A841GRJ0_9BACT|nr:phosphoribosylformylglycinamidine cyclo-ligase [Longimicrobium terrae]MBB6069760.1 phosphoribosylformylglycinamidine cyclo-ligase [Longimicrobium terrae]NNC31029.1 phosphoribosylformylglycinamidine cyclo-ligase [Longimicrobium terrae]
MSEQPGLSYAAAGVDIDAAHQAMKGVAAMVRSTATPDTLSELGSFGGLYRVPRDAKQPVLVASTDGVGTKLKVAFMAGRHGTVGEDLVNHCVNDILVQGAKPLFFLDYVGVGKLEPGVVEELVSGVARGCRANGCALLGGETAEMPDMYTAGEYDLAGTIVGMVEEDRVLDGRAIRPGDAIVAVASNGLHTNGYSLARRIVFDRMGLGVDDAFPEEEGSVADVLLRVHKSYLRSLYPLIEAGRIRGLAHITGGGLVDNVPRILPDGAAARFDLSSWTVPSVFRVLRREGGVARDEMFRAFNMGVGMAAVVPAPDADAVVRDLAAAGETAWIAGEIVPGARDVILSGE